LIGDRQLNTFSLVQRKQDFVIFYLLKKLEKIKKQSETKEVFIIVNNHFTGFAPETANHLKNLLSLPVKRFNNQKTLFDF